MLYLTRKVGESIVINDDIEVTVVDIRGKTIKLGFTFPPEASVLRREIYDRIQEENKAAALSSGAILEALGQGTASEDTKSQDSDAEVQGRAKPKQGEKASIKDEAEE